jgi:hypothetical protein
MTSLTMRMFTNGMVSSPSMLLTVAQKVLAPLTINRTT